MGDGFLHSRRPTAGPPGGSAWGVALLGLLIGAALAAPWLSSHDPLLPSLPQRLLAPTSLHPFGTDGLGRDVLARLLFGARVSLAVGVLTMAFATVAGSLLGALAGYQGGLWDHVISRSIDVVLSVPRLVLLIVIVAALGEPSFGAVVAVLAFTQWPQVARLVRGEVIRIKAHPFVEGARASGVPDALILRRHILPHALGPIVVAATLGIGDTIALEAGLSFLGLGVQPPFPSWGAMVAQGRDHLLSAWWISTFAGLAIVMTVVAFTLAGEGLRRALDPSARG